MSTSPSVSSSPSVSTSPSVSQTLLPAEVPAPSDPVDSTTVEEPSLILDRITALSAADRVANFTALKLWTVAYCLVKITVSIAAYLFFGSYLWALIFFHAMAVLMTRLIVDKIEDQEQALVHFGLCWLFSTIVVCSTFVGGNWLNSYVTDVPDGAVWVLAYLIVLVPIDLQVMPLGCIYCGTAPVPPVSMSKQRGLGSLTAPWPLPRGDAIPRLGHAPRAP